MKTLRFQRSEVVDFFREQFKDQADAVMAEGAVLDLVRQGIISSGKAAELLGVSRWDMPDLLAKHAIDTTEYTPEEVEREASVLRQAKEPR